MLDVTSTRHAEQTAIDNEERVRQLIDNTADAFLVHDADGRFMEANAAACELLGYSRQELVGMRVGDVQPEEIENFALALGQGHVALQGLQGTDLAVDRTEAE